MALNTSAKDIRIARRERVARLRLRGFTQRDIQRALSDPQRGMRDPKTGKPYSLMTINRDCKWIDKSWRENILALADEHNARILAEINEVKRTAWKDGDMQVVLRALKQEVDLFGLEAPKQTEIGAIGGGPITIRVRYDDDND